ncbi:MFS transporter [Methanobacterium alcaliphilum]|uniref:MFS transporter n=1 Tax=Methanobacterium alcaliphilum TaxID=392018 RepID=UPI00200A34DB|nr:MFS transporter [Methanobacterium alcaliphilum]MCK9151209.1 MFS transporter [Methanobacterium alcaliphilum]
MSEVLDKKNSRYVLAVVILGAFLIPFMGAALNVSLPSIGNEFLIDLVWLSWIPTAFILANAAFILPFGRLGDIYGRKKIFTSGVIIFALASLMAALSPSGILLIISSFLQGLGCSMIFATGVAILSSVFPVETHGQSFGIYIAAVYAGLLAGPILGGFLTQTFGWRSIFLFNIPLCIAILSLIVLKLNQDWSGSYKENFDIKGTLIYIPSISILLYGFTNVFQWYGQLMIGLGILFLILFIIIEYKTFNPLINPRIFKKIVPGISSLTTILMITSTSAVWTLISLYLQYIQTLSPLIVGIILSIQPLIVAIFSPFTGKLSDNINGAYLVLIGMILISMGLFLGIFIELNTPLIAIVMLAVLLGLGNALFSSPNTNIFMGSVDKKFYGSSSAVLSTIIFTGQLLSLGILILIFTGTLGGLEVVPSQYGTFIISLKDTFTIFTALSIIGTLIISLLVLKIGKNKI